MQEQHQEVQVEQVQPRISEADRKRLHRYWAKLLRRVVRPMRLTKRGYAMQPEFEQDEEDARLGRRWVYRLTSREASRRKSMRRQQAASRRANRG